jgi:hypothetical protein
MRGFHFGQWILRKAMSHIMRVVTSGSAYLDIDAFACCIAYAELLNHQGINARAVSSAR